MKNHLQQLSIEKLIELRKQLKSQLYEDILGESPEIRLKFRDVNNIIYIKIIDNALVDRNISKMISAYNEVGGVFRNIHVSNISNELDSKFTELSNAINSLPIRKVVIQGFIEEL